MPEHAYLFWICLIIHEQAIEQLILQKLGALHVKCFRNIAMRACRSAPVCCRVHDTCNAALDEKTNHQSFGRSDCYGCASSTMREAEQTLVIGHPPWPDAMRTAHVDTW
jgi:hypothetical protein